MKSRSSSWRRTGLGLAWGVLVLGLVLAGCTGDTGPAGPAGPEGPAGTAGTLEGPFLRSELSTAQESCTVCHGTGRDFDIEWMHRENEESLPSFLPAIDVSMDGGVVDGVPLVSQITGVTTGATSTVTFTLRTENDIDILGLDSFWNDSNRFVRFTMTQLQPGTNGDPDSWVAYTRDTVNDGSTPPDYDTGSSFVDNGGGSYTFTFNTDITNVTGVTFDGDLTHRVAGQIGSGGSPIDPQNMFFDFVPNMKSLRTRNIAVMDSCNECHDDLVFHGRRFLVEYCVQCHNPDLVGGEGNLSFMTHRIHVAGSFPNLDGGIDYGELTYPQDLKNCRKCHSAGMPASVTTTSEGDNWMNLPNKAACDGCHGEIEGDTFDNYHTGGAQSDNSGCAGCHPPSAIEGYHVTDNATTHNPFLQSGQREISYELVDADVVAGQAIIIFRILSDGTPIDVTNLPAEFADAAGVAFRYPGLLLAWAQAQDGIAAPADFNNLGRRGAQPLSISLGALAPIDATSVIGSLTWDAGSQSNTATINAASAFPGTATMRTVGLQGYLQQDLNGDGTDDVNLHTPSAVATVNKDDVRRRVVENARCGKCHEWFEGHGGNRVYEIAICTLCHVPNQSSSGRTIVTPSQGLLDDFTDHGPIPGVDPNDPLTYPEDAQNLKDLVHGIHSSGFRTRDFQHVRGGREGYYNWSHVTFPRGASTANCKLCHEGDETYALPLDSGVLATTVRTTSVADGNDADNAAVEGAFQTVPNDTDWVNSPTASACGYCHTWDEAVAHMRQMGGFLTVPK